MFLSSCGVRKLDKENLLKLLGAAQAFDAVEKGHIQSTVEFVLNNPDPFNSENCVGHVTASAWILDASLQNALLTHHAKLQRWFQLGGHVEPSDKTIMSAALREAAEESGLKDLKFKDEMGIFDVDVHLIPANKKGMPDHFHYDIRFLFTTDFPDDMVVSEESLDLAWVSLSHAIEISTNASIVRMVNKTLKMTSVKYGGELDAKGF